MNRPKIHRIVAAILITALLLPSSGPAAAASIDDKRAELNSINQQLQNTRQKIREAEQKERELVGQIKESDRRLNELSQELESLAGQLRNISDERCCTETELENLQKLLMQTNNELEVAQYELERQRNLLDERLTNLYKKGDTIYYEVILGVADFSDFFKRLDFLNLIVRQDKDILDQIDKTKRIIEDKKAQIEVQEAKVQEKRLVLINQQRQVESVSRSVENKKGEVATEQQHKQGLLVKVQEDKESYIKMERELEQASRDIARMIRALESRRKNRRTPINSTGILMWPVSGYISSDFGQRVHPIFKVSSFHSGIDIGASSGTPIKAADSGEVLFSGWRGGYGRTVIIAHGGDQTTLYGHCSSLNVNTGDIVQKGDIIAAVGSTGYSTGPHLHFEVRANGEPQDPMGWL